MDGQQQGEAAGGDPDSSPFHRPVLLGVIGAVCGLWFLGCLISTKCCRHLGGNDPIYDDADGGVWDAPVIRTQQQRQDSVLAQELQEAELIAAQSPEELEASRLRFERKKKIREDFVEKVLPRDQICDAENGLDAQQCPICLATYTEGECITSGTTGHCQHIFHRNCIADWLVRKSICPVCRTIFLQEDVKSPENEEEEKHSNSSVRNAQDVTTPEDSTATDALGDANRTSVLQAAIEPPVAEMQSATMPDLESQSDG